MKNSSSTSPTYCPTCKRRIGDPKSGSLTGWIFGGTTCGCNLGKLLFDSAKFETLEVAEHNEPPVQISERYRTETLIDKGGMSMVYKAWDDHLEKVCVAKILRDELVNTPQFLNRFRMEAKLCARFTHPNLVPVTDYGISQQSLPFIIMELVDGSTLKSVLQSGKLSLVESVQLALQMASALDSAHELSIVHRDLKPGNVLISTNDEGATSARIIDFGIARQDHQGGEIQRLTSTGAIFGTVQYMSPEQCFGLKVDRRTDIYSLGCILYEMISGQPPFRGGSQMEVMQKQVNETPPPIKNSSDGTPVSAELNAIVLKCLQKEPEQRYASMKELITDIESKFLDRAIKGQGSIRLPRVLAAVAILLIAAGSIVFFAGTTFQEAIDRVQTREITNSYDRAIAFTNKAQVNDDVVLPHESEKAFSEALDQPYLSDVAKCTIAADYGQYIYNTRPTRKGLDKIAALFNKFEPELKRLSSGESFDKSAGYGGAPLLYLLGSESLNPSVSPDRAISLVENGLAMATRDPQAKWLVPGLKLWRAKLYLKTDQPEKAIKDLESCNSEFREAHKNDLLLTPRAGFTELYMSYYMLEEAYIQAGKMELAQHAREALMNSIRQQKDDQKRRVLLGLDEQSRKAFKDYVHDKSGGSFSVQLQLRESGR